jgi:DNA-binding transcriptional ArsR family regulator
MGRSGVEALIPRSLVAGALALAALAFPVSSAFGVDVGLHGLPLAHGSLHRDVPVPTDVVLVDDLSVDASPAMVDDAAPADSPPSEEPSHDGEPTSDSPLLQTPGILLPVTATVGALPALGDLGQPLPVSLGTILPASPSQEAAPVAPPAEPVTLQAEAATPVAAAPPATVAASLVAVAAVSAAAPALGWDRLKRVLLPLALYTRIAKERLLDHGSREKLLLAIRERPGLPVTDLAEGTGVPRNTATYHLRRLEREGLVVSQRSGRVRVWFAPGGQARREEAPAFAALRHDTTRAIAMQVAAQPGVDQQALCARFGLAPSLAHWHADRLVQTGLVRKERDGRRVRYYPTEGLPRMATLSG